jgi:hypothetical protein
MRTFGIATANVLLYALFVGATVCVLLGVLLAGLRMVVWPGLAFPVGGLQVLLLFGAAAAAVGIGTAVVRWGGEQR